MKAKTLSHEMGHYFGLRHVWGDGDCTEDDGIDDTPDMAGNTQDNLAANFDALNYTCVSLILSIPAPTISCRICMKT
ncbi:MAG: M43 family zinc metalloprotease [Saprospiraceae bacterium]